MIDPRDSLICKLHKRQELTEAYGVEAEGFAGWPMLNVTEMRLLEFALTLDDD